MATEKQIAANQRNAALSTGPKTAEGKARSRANAMTHGLTAVTLVSPAHQTDAELRYAAWLPSFKPEADFQKFQVRTVVEASLRIENCWARESERKTELAGIATESSTRWEVERRKEASKLGRSLRRNPEEIALQLRSTPAGREWMIGRWTLLLKAVSKEQIGSWRGPESSEALDLMGKPKFLRNLLDQDNLFPDPDTIRVLILKEIAALEVDQRNATQEDHRLRGLHARGLIFETDAALTRIRRYEKLGPAVVR